MKRPAMTPKRASIAIAACAAVSALAVLAVARWVPTVPRYETPAAAAMAAGMCPAALLFEAAMPPELVIACGGFSAPEPHERCDRMVTALAGIDTMAVLLDSDPNKGEDHERGVASMMVLRTLIDVAQIVECGADPGPATNVDLI